MRPEIPADLNSLAASELRALRNAIRTYSLSILADPAITAEQRADLASLALVRDQAKTIADAKDADAAALAALAAEGEDEEPAIAEDQTITPPPGATDPANVTAPHPVVENPPTPPAPAGDHSTIPTTTGAPSVPAAPGAGTSTLTAMSYSGGVANHAADAPVSSWAELANSLALRGDSVANSNMSEHFEVARIRANYGPERTIDGPEYRGGLARFERPEEITAALCAPGTPYYGLACDNTLRRPVFGSMGQFAAPRGKVSIPTSPTLSDITGQNAGYGQWTFANDDDGSVKNCAVVACNSFNDFQLYGIWKCLTVKNLVALTYPELVEAYLNRLGAAQARMAEILLLEAMATATTAVQGPSLGYGAATSFTSLVLEYAALYQETQRWDISDGLEAWMPRWVLTALQVDLMRRRTTNGTLQNIPSQSAIESMLASAGLNVHWFIDTPSWAPSIPAVHSGGTMNRLPTTIPVIVAKRGKFAVIDRGNLSIGVTGNNIYRDNSSNRTNTYTFFMESFEGLVNTDSCPAHLLRIPVCYNGVQVDDRLVDCLGIDELGYQS